MLQANSLLGCSYVGVAHRESPHSLHPAALLSALEKDSSFLSTTTSVLFPPLQGYPVIHPPCAARATSLTHLLSTIWEAPHLHTSRARQGLWQQTNLFSLHPLLWLKSSSWSANKPVSPKLTESEFPDCNSYVPQRSLVHTCCCHSSQASSAQTSREASLSHSEIQITAQSPKVYTTVLFLRAGWAFWAQNWAPPARPSEKSFK